MAARKSATKSAVPFAAARAGLPDVHYGSTTHYAYGDTGVSKWTITGTTPSSERIEALGCDFYTFRGGLVTVKDSYWKRVDPV
jgi:hypothetical protein